MADTKVCTRCGEEKALDQFRLRGGGRKGRQTWCIACYKTYGKAWHVENKDAAHAKYWANVDENRRKARAALVLRKYGITVEDYDRMLHEQGGGCAICGGTGGMSHMVNPLTIDHDHQTGRVRGLLCAGCNTGMGGFKDNPERLEAAAAYLRRHGTT